MEKRGREREAGQWWQGCVVVVVVDEHVRHHAETSRCVVLLLPYVLLTQSHPVRKLSVATASHSATPQPATPTSSNAKGNQRTAERDGVKIGTGDSTRDKCAELIYDALAADSGARTSYRVTSLAQS